MTTLSLTVTEDGLRLPRRLFKHAGEVEVIERDDYLLIKPKTAEREASRAQAIAALREAGLVITPEWPAPPAVSPEERARLAQKISAGQPLSEIIIADRADRA